MHTCWTSHVWGVSLFHKTSNRFSHLITCRLFSFDSHRFGSRPPGEIWLGEFYAKTDFQMLIVLTINFQLKIQMMQEATQQIVVNKRSGQIDAMWGSSTANQTYMSSFFASDHVIFTSCRPPKMNMKQTKETEILIVKIVIITTRRLVIIKTGARCKQFRDRDASMSVEKFRYFMCEITDIANFVWPMVRLNCQQLLIIWHFWKSCRHAVSQVAQKVFFKLHKYGNLKHWTCDQRANSCRKTFISSTP